MKRDAEAHAEDDRKKRELIDARNRAEQQAFEMEKQLKEHGDKIPAGDRSAVESAISHVREVAKGNDAAAIQKAVDNLSTAAQNMGKVIYEEMAKQQAAASGGRPAGASSGDGGAAAGKADEDVIDAEYEVKK